MCVGFSFGCQHLVVASFPAPKSIQNSRIDAVTHHGLKNCFFPTANVEHKVWIIGRLVGGGGGGKTASTAISQSCKLFYWDAMKRGGSGASGRKFGFY